MCQIMSILGLVVSCGFRVSLWSCFGCFISHFFYTPCHGVLLPLVPEFRELFSRIAKRSISHSLWQGKGVADTLAKLATMLRRSLLLLFVSLRSGARCFKFWCMERLNFDIVTLLEMLLSPFIPEKKLTDSP